MNKATLIPTAGEVLQMRAANPDRIVKGKFIVSEIVKQHPDGSVEQWRKFDDGSEEDKPLFDK